MDKKFTATELLTKSDEVYKRLQDDESKQMYEIRLKYLITRDNKAMQNDIVNYFILNASNEKPKLDEIFDANAPIDHIVIFGAGKDGHFVFGLLQQTKYKSKNIVFCDNDSNKWNIDKIAGGGVLVISPQELMTNYRNSVVIIGSHTIKTRELIYEQLVKMGYPKEKILYSQRHVAGYQELLGLSTIWRIRQLEEIYNLSNNLEEIVIVGDEADKEYTQNLLKQSIFSDVKVILSNELSAEQLKNYPKNRIINNVLNGYRGWQYFDYFAPNDSEIFIDGGSYDAQMAVEFTEWAAKGYDFIYSFEANPNMGETCQETFQKHKLKGEVINKGLWCNEDTLYFNINSTNAGASRIRDDGQSKIKTTSIDEILKGSRASFIKMDIEGAEFKAIIGAKETIRKWNPRLAICVYHKPEDILEIPLLLLEIKPDYKFAIRQYASSGGETVLYAY